MQQHAADLLKIFLPVVAEIFWKFGDEVLKCIHLSGGKMALRNSGRLARDPDSGYAFCSGPEFNQRALWVKSRLDGMERESFMAKAWRSKNLS